MISTSKKKTRTRKNQILIDIKKTVKLRDNQILHAITKLLFNIQKKP